MFLIVITTFNRGIKLLSLYIYKKRKNYEKVFGCLFYLSQFFCLVAMRGVDIFRSNMCDN